MPAVRAGRRRRPTSSARRAAQPLGTAAHRTRGTRGGRPAASRPRPPPSTPAAAGRRAAPAHCTCGGEIDADGLVHTCGLRAPSERDHFTEQPAPDVAACATRAWCTRATRTRPRSRVADDRTRAGGVRRRHLGDRQRRRVAGRGARRARRARRRAAGAVDRARARSVEHWTDAARRDATAAAQARGRGRGASRSGRARTRRRCTFVAAVVDGPVLVAALGRRQPLLLVRPTTARRPGLDRRLVGERRRSPQGIAARGRRGRPRGPRHHPLARRRQPRRRAVVPRRSPVDRPGLGAGLQRRPLELLLARRRPPRARWRDQVADVGADPLAVASALCDWANEQGGHDNVTVALARLAVRPAPSDRTDRNRTRST